MRFEMTGFDELQKTLEQMKQAISELSGSHNVPLVDLFTDAFMSEHTRFSSFGEMLESGGFSVNSQEEFDAIPQELLDRHVASSTDFDSWGAMVEAGAQEYFARKLGF